MGAAAASSRRDAAHRSQSHTLGRAPRRRGAPARQLLPAQCPSLNKMGASRDSFERGLVWAVAGEGDQQRVVSGQHFGVGGKKGRREGKGGRWVVLERHCEADCCSVPQGHAGLIHLGCGVGRLGSGPVQRHLLSPVLA